MTVFLDQYSADVLRIDRPEQKSASGQAYEYWAFPVHLGTFGGLPIRLIWLGACTGPLLLGATGLTTFGVRRGKRRRRRRGVRRALPSLGRAKANDVAQHAMPRGIAPGDVIAAEGAASDSFFVVVKGTLDVARSEADGRTTIVRTLGPGDHFGEIGLLQGTPRTATVTATSAGEVIVLSRQGFDRLVEESQAARGDLESVTEARLAADRSRDEAEPDATS